MRDQNRGAAADWHIERIVGRNTVIMRVAVVLPVRVRMAVGVTVPGGAASVVQCRNRDPAAKAEKRQARQGIDDMAEAKPAAAPAAQTASPIAKVEPICPAPAHNAAPTVSRRDQ
jgi:hypothetical protein